MMTTQWPYTPGTGYCVVSLDQGLHEHVQTWGEALGLGCLSLGQRRHDPDARPGPSYSNWGCLTLLLGLKQPPHYAVLPPEPPGEPPQTFDVPFLTLQPPPSTAPAPRRRMGRPRKAVTRGDVLAGLAKGDTMLRIAHMLGVSLSTLERRLKEEG